MHNPARSNWRNWRLTASGTEPAAPDMPPQRANLAEQPGPDGIRWGLVRRIQAEIAAGTYDCEDRFAVAEERLLARLNG